MISQGIAMAVVVSEVTHELVSSEEPLSPTAEPLRELTLCYAPTGGTSVTSDDDGDLVLPRKR
jgi:hypothetical protein